jgi:hypothetical protein
MIAGIFILILVGILCWAALVVLAVCASLVNFSFHRIGIPLFIGWGLIGILAFLWILERWLS